VIWNRWLLIITFIAAQIAALYITPLIVLDFQYPTELATTPYPFYFHPKINILRYLVAIFPSLIWAAWEVWRSRSAVGGALPHPDSTFDVRASRTLLILISLVMFSQLALAIVSIPRPTSLDNFSGGEHFGAAYAVWESGKIFGSAMFPHGLLIDIAPNLVGWSYFGSGHLGGRVAFDLPFSVVFFVAVATFCSGIISLTRKDLGKATGTYAGISFAFMVLVGWKWMQLPNVLTHREIPVWLTLGFVFLAMSRGYTLLWLAAGASLFFGYMYSIDRATYALLLVPTSIILAAMIRTISMKQAINAACWVAVGFGIVTVFVFSILGFGEWQDFLSTFLHYVRYSDFTMWREFEYRELFSNPLSMHSVAVWLGIISILSLACVVRCYQARGWKSLTVIHGSLLAYALISLRSCMTNSDIPHVIYSLGGFVTALTFTMFAILVLLRSRVLLFSAYFLVALTSAWTFSDSLSASAKLVPSWGESVDAISNATDEAFMNEDVKRLLPELKEVVGNEQCLFIFSNEPGWHYWLRKPSCTRFNVIAWAVSHKSQSEIIQQLESSKPNFIVCESRSWEALIGGMPPRDKHLHLGSYIQSRYSFYRHVGYLTICKRND
jgi:hypothetical protein